MPSTVIKSIKYRPEANELDILFVTGRRYLYHEVPPETAERFTSAFAKGRYFNRHIRGRFHCTEVVEPKPARSSPA